MTRKRFCKKLMGLGVERNTAAMFASRVGPRRSYKEEYPWAAYTACFGICGISVKKAERAFRRLAKAWRAALA